MIKCPKCGNELIIINNGREIKNKCSVCDYEVVTTYNSEMDNDTTKYVISILKDNCVSIDNIKLISKMTGDNFILSKFYLINGYDFEQTYAEQVQERKHLLDENKIKYTILPKFPY